LVSPGGQFVLQAPAEQKLPGTHTLLHRPQSPGFDQRSTHTPLQNAGEIPAVQTHSPPLHCCPMPQARLHAPQSDELLVRSTQTPPQSTKLPAHFSVQRPLAQNAPGGQTAEQDPQ
jgi:hypothetical protein